MTDTEKRGTGTDYGQDKLRVRSANIDSPITDDSQKSNKILSVKKILSVMVAVIIAGGALGTIALTTSSSPAQNVENHIFDVNKDGVPLTNTVLPEETTNTVSTESSPSEKPVTSDTKPEEIIAKIPISPPENAEPAIGKANTLAPSEVKKSATDVVIPELPVIAVDPAYNRGTDAKPDTLESFTPEELLVIQASPAPSTEVLPAEQVVKLTTDIAPSSAGSAPNAVEYDPTKFGITEVPSTTEAAPETVTTPEAVVEPELTQNTQVKPNNELTPREASVPQQPQYALPESFTGQDLNYTGLVETVAYKTQQQDTIYLYGTFASKVYLLPIDSKDTVSAYLSDEKGWSMKLLPGGIIRIQRSENKGSWSSATDLFIVAGKRTYSIILQGVGEPAKRTDSLRYVQPEPEKSSTGKKR